MSMPCPPFTHRGSTQPDARPAVHCDHCGSAHVTWFTPSRAALDAGRIVLCNRCGRLSISLGAGGGRSVRPSSAGPLAA